MTLLKYVLVFLGGVFIGLGAGTILGNSLFVTDVNYWAFSAGSLVLGGFLMALGIMAGGRGKNKKDDEQNESQSSLAEASDSPGDSGDKI